MSNIIKQPCDDGVIGSAPDSTPCKKVTGTWVLVATILGSSMAFIDGTVVNVALPVMQVELEATVVDAQWIVESYALFLAALILVGGALGDRFGRRKVFGWGIGLFAAASMWCGLAPSVEQLIIARAAQGVGGALLVPGSLAIISSSFDGEGRGRAIGTWSGFTAITAAIGPVMGGWLVENASWRWVFFVNAPIAVAVLAILFARVPESRDENASRLDVWGAVTATVGLGALVFGLIESAHLGFGDGRVVGALFLGSLSLVSFVLVESRIEAPMMPLDLFRSKTFSGTNLMTLFLYAALSGALFFLPFNLIQVQGYSPTAAGAAFLPLILIIFLLSRWAGGLVERYGAKLPLVIGPLVAAVGYLLFLVPGIGGSYWSTFFPAMVVLGIGMAISVAPLTTAVMGSVAASRAGVASGVNNAVSRAAGLLSIAVMGIFMLMSFNTELDARLEQMGATESTYALIEGEREKMAGAVVPDALGDTTAEALRKAIKASYLESFRKVMLAAASLALVGSIVSVFTIPRVRDST